MRFEFADAFRLTALYALGYLAIAGVAIAAFRFFGVGYSQVVEDVATGAAFIYAIIVHRNVLDGCVDKGLPRWKWYGAFLFGALLLITTLAVFYGITVILTTPGFPLEQFTTNWLYPVLGSLNAGLMEPVFSPEGLWAHAVVFAITFPLVLLALWPAGNLLARRSSRPARAYIVAFAIAGMIETIAIDAAKDYAPAFLSDLPEPALWGSLFAMAVVTGIVNAAIVSLGLWRMAGRRRTEAPAQ